MDLARLRKLVTVLARYGFDSFVAGVSIPGFSRAARSDEVTPRPASERFRLMLEELGPIFIKFGQLLSTRPDILPPDFIGALSGLQEDVSPMPWDLIQGELETHLPGKISELFQSIDPEPLATASVSQVHQAALKSGEAVVIKIRRPDIDDIIRSDLEFLRGVARLLGNTIVEVSRHDPESWVNEFAQALNHELDLMNEVEALETFRANGSETGQLVVPMVYSRLCSSRVMVMEFLKGIPLLQVEDKEERRRIARLLIGEAYKQIFVDGFFHADPHPGNIRYLADGRIGLLDFGLVGQLTAKMRDLLIRLAVAVAIRDAKSAARIIYSAGLARERIDLTVLSRDIEEILGTTMGRSLQDIDTERVAIELLAVITRHGVTLPQGLAMLGKAGINLEGVVRTLAPDMDLSQEALPYARRLISIPDSPLELATEVFRQALRFRAMVEELPLQIDQIMMDVSSGKLNVNFSSKQLDGLVPSIREHGVLLGLGMVAAASVVAAALLIGPYLAGTRLLGVPVLPALAVLMTTMASVLMIAVIVWALFRGRDLRIRLSSWIPWLRRRQAARDSKKALG